MAFLAAGLVKGAQYVRREQRKNRERNALITAPGHVLADERQLTIERDWWGDAQDSATVESSREAPGSKKEQNRPQTLSDSESGDNDEDSPPPPVVTSLDEFTDSSGTVSKPVQGSYAKKLETSGKDTVATRKIPPTRRQAAPTGSFQAALQSETASRAQSSKLASGSRTYASSASVPSRRRVATKPKAAAPPRRSDQPSTATSGSFAEALERDVNASAPSNARPGGLKRTKKVVAGSFLEATKGSESWNEFISSVEQDKQRDLHHKTPSR